MLPIIVLGKVCSQAALINLSLERFNRTISSQVVGGRSSVQEERRSKLAISTGLCRYVFPHKHNRRPASRFELCASHIRAMI